MRSSWLGLLGGLCTVTLAWGAPSYEGTFISNPPQPPSNCITLRSSLSLVDDTSGDIYYLYKCHEPSNNLKYLRLWHTRAEESKAGEIADNPIRIINELILPYPDDSISEFDLYPCSITNEAHVPALAILPSKEPIVNAETVNKAIAVWMVEGDKLENISSSRIAWCEL